MYADCDALTYHLHIVKRCTRNIFSDQSVTPDFITETGRVYQICFENKTSSVVRVQEVLAVMKYLNHRL